MNINGLFFAIASFTTVLLYLPIAGAAGWKNRNVYDIETSYWNALEAFVWSLGMILFRGSVNVNIWAILPILPTALIYGLILEQPELTFFINKDTSLTTAQIAMVSSLGVVVGLYFIVSLALDPYKSTLLYRLLPVFLFIIWLLVWLGVNKASDKTTFNQLQPTQYSFSFSFDDNEPVYQTVPTETTQYNYILQPDSWVIGVIGFLLCLSPDIHGQIMSGIFWGIFCQTAASFGITPPTNVEKTRTSGTERIPLTKDASGSYVPIPVSR